MRANQLDVAAIAIIRRALDSGADRDEVLLEAGLTEPQWRTMEEDVLEGLADDIDRGDTSRVERYRKAYEGAAEEAPVTDPGPPAATPEDPALELAGPRTVGPSELQASPMPFRSSPDRVRFDPDSTADIGRLAAAARAPAIPFDAAAKPKPPPAIPVAPREPSTSDTADFTDMLQAAGLVRATPFREDMQAPPPEPPPPAPRAAPSRRAPKTMMVDASALRGPALPFRGGAPSQRPIEDEGTTDDATSPMKDAFGLPFKREQAAVTIERFAIIQAALVKGARPEVVLAQHGFTQQAWAAAFSAMRERFAADPALRLRYEQLFREALS